MKKIKSIVYAITVFAVIIGISIPVKGADVSQNGYEETRGQFYFDNIDVVVANDEELILSPASDANFIERIATNLTISEFNSFIENCPETEKSLALQATMGELCAVAYTETPVILVDGHYERMASDFPSTQYEEEWGDAFTMTTAITRGIQVGATGEYKYLTVTVGEWAGTSIIGLSNYPASGDDYIVQTMGTQGVIVDSSIETMYNDDEMGDSSDAYPTDGGENYIKYVVKDDPIGLRQLVGFIFMVEYHAPLAGYTRAVSTSYTHTWGYLNIEIELTATTGIYDENITTSLLIIPSIDYMHWTLYNHCAFLF